MRTHLSFKFLACGSREGVRIVSGFPFGCLRLGGYHEVFYSNSNGPRAVHEPSARNACRVGAGVRDVRREVGGDALGVARGGGGAVLNNGAAECE